MNTHYKFLDIIKKANAFFFLSIPLLFKVAGSYILNLNYLLFVDKLRWLLVHHYLFSDNLLIV